MKPETILRRAQAVQDELDRLAGMSNDTSTALGRKTKNRKSQLYRMRRRYDALMEMELIRLGRIARH